MRNIFIITASNSLAQQHLQDTIAKQIHPGNVEKFFSGDELRTIKEIGASEGYYAWGARPSKGNIGTWSRIQAGDYILAYQEGFYTYLSEVIYKTINKGFAEQNWGNLEEGDTWDHIYFLRHPQKIDPPLKAEDIANYLPSRLMGFTRISDGKISKIIEDFSNIETFFNNHFPGINLTTNYQPGFWWVNQGKSYTPDKGQKYIWAPKSGKGGIRPKYWQDMEAIRKGDIVLNYAKGALRGISIASNTGYDFFNAESEDWDKNGIRVDFEHYSIDPIQIEVLKANYPALIEILGEKIGPFDKNGDIKQGYLFEFNLPAAKIIRRLYGKPFPEPIESILQGAHPVPHIKNMVLGLLSKKGQIILYGPPGTGKTFITRKLALEFLNYVENDQDSDDLPDYPSDGPADSAESKLMTVLFQFAESLEGIRRIPRKSMIGYYSMSNYSKKETGLVWISKTVQKSGAFKVHLRKESASRYPVRITEMLRQYKANGWGGYPEFIVENDQDVKNAEEMIKFAYDQF